MFGTVYENCMSTYQLNLEGRTDGPNFRLEKKKAMYWLGSGLDLILTFLCLCVYKVCKGEATTKEARSRGQMLCMVGQMKKLF